MHPVMRYSLRKAFDKLPGSFRGASAKLLGSAREPFWKSSAKPLGSYQEALSKSPRKKLVGCFHAAPRKSCRKLSRSFLEAQGCMRLSNGRVQDNPFRGDGGVSRLGNGFSCSYFVNVRLTRVVVGVVLRCSPSAMVCTQ